MMFRHVVMASIAVGTIFYGMVTSAYKARYSK